MRESCELCPKRNNCFSLAEDPSIRPARYYAELNPKIANVIVNEFLSAGNRWGRVDNTRNIIANCICDPAESARIRGILSELEIFLARNDQAIRRSTACSFEGSRGNIRGVLEQVVDDCLHGSRTVNELTLEGLVAEQRKLLSETLGFSTKLEF